MASSIRSRRRSAAAEIGISPTDLPPDPPRFRRTVREDSTGVAPRDKPRRRGSTSRAQRDLEPRGRDGSPGDSVSPLGSRASRRASLVEQPAAAEEDGEYAAAGTTPQDWPRQHGSTSHTACELEPRRLEVSCVEAGSPLSFRASRRGSQRAVEQAGAAEEDGMALPDRKRQLLVNVAFKQLVVKAIAAFDIAKKRAVDAWSSRVKLLARIARIVAPAQLGFVWMLQRRWVCVVLARLVTTWRHVALSKEHKQQFDAVLKSSSITLRRHKQEAQKQLDAKNQELAHAQHKISVLQQGVDESHEIIEQLQTDLERAQEQLITRAEAIAQSQLNLSEAAVSEEKSVADMQKLLDQERAARAADKKAADAQLAKLQGELKAKELSGEARILELNQEIIALQDELAEVQGEFSQFIDDYENRL